MKNLILIAITMLFSFCNKDERTVIDTNIDISIVDSEGNDLLDPANPSAFSENDIDTYYLENGVLEKFYKYGSDYPKGIFIFMGPNKKYRLAVANYNNGKEIFQNIYIKYHNLDIDTIKCEMHYAENLRSCVKVWYNDELKWDINSKTERYFEIVK